MDEQTDMDRSIDGPTDRQTDRLNIHPKTINGGIPFNSAIVASFCSGSWTSLETFSETAIGTGAVPLAATKHKVLLIYRTIPLQTTFN